MIVLVQVQTYFDDKYHGSIFIDEEMFRVERNFLWQKWKLLDDAGIGYNASDEWDVFPIHPNQEYEITWGDGHQKIQTKVIG